MNRLDELQHEFVERHKDTDLIERSVDGKAMCAIYFSPAYRTFERARKWRSDGNERVEQKKSQVSPGVDAPVEGKRR